MSTSATALLLLTPALFVVAWLIRAFLTVRRRSQPFLSRPCTGRAWKRQFPSASAKEIRAFLHLFCAAFTFPRKRPLSFLPQDRLADIYYARNPPEYGLPDSLDLDVFSDRLAQAYGIELPAFWRDDLTLGDVFARTHEKA